MWGVSYNDLSKKKDRSCLRNPMHLQDPFLPSSSGSLRQMFYTTKICNRTWWKWRKWDCDWNRQFKLFSSRMKTNSLGQRRSFLWTLSEFIRGWDNMWTKLFRMSGLRRLHQTSVAKWKFSIFLWKFNKIANARTARWRKRTGQCARVVIGFNICPVILNGIQKPNQSVFSVLNANGSTRKRSGCLMNWNSLIMKRHPHGLS